MTDFFSLDPDEQLQRLEAAGRDVLSAWDLGNATLELIKHRENAVFRVERDGFKAELRLHRHGYHSDDELRSELQWMQALSDAGVKVPNVIPAARGELFVTYSADGLPGELQVDLFEWIDGEQLGSVEEGVNDAAGIEATYLAIGELAARVHNQAESWELPQGFVRHSWDADGLAGERPFWGQFWNLAAASKAEKELLQRGRDRAYADLSQVSKSPGNYSMIHADFAPENVMVDGNGVRLIDFDDAGFGWHLFELATSLYFVQDEPWFDQAKDALIRGYRLHRQLADEELELLPLFFLARGFTYVGWVHTRQETETARELTPMLLASACELAEDYLRN
jgi:Ser/Thr protein kinase RdoA (MazF antagonist)